MTNRDEVAHRVRRLRSHGMTTLTWDRHRGHANSYDVEVHGYNYRLDELHAALGRVQLAKLPANNVRRSQLAETYRRALAPLEEWVVPFRDHPGESASHLSVVIAPDRSMRDEAVTRLRAQGIQTSMHYPCVADFTAFTSLAARDLERSRDFASRAITLPLFPTMTSDQVADVCRELAVAAGQEAARGSVQWT